MPSATDTAAIAPQPDQAMTARHRFVGRWAAALRGGSHGDAERRREMLQRLTIAATFGPVVIIVAAITNWFVFSERLDERLATFALEAGACFAILRIARRPGAERWAMPLGAAFALSMGACTLWAASLSPDDLDVLLGGIVAVMVGSALLFPWGPLVQLVVSGAVGAGYVALMLSVAPPDSTTRLTNIVISVLVAVLLSVAGAWMLDRQRRANAALVEGLQRTDRLKSEFVSTMSHELRTPLNVIIGYSEMTREEDLDTEERDRFLQKIEAASRELLELIESTLDISRLEAGRHEPRLERVELSSFIRHLAKGCQRLPRKPGVTLEWFDDVPADHIVTDPRKLTVILRNLVGNALKFTEQGWVRVGMTMGADEVVFTISDTGIGIPSAEQDAIFQMFRQSDGSDSRRFGGVGLGLYIVRRFTDQLGGSVTLASDPGRGSTFTVRVPSGDRRRAAA